MNTQLSKPSPVMWIATVLVAATCLVSIVLGIDMMLRPRETESGVPAFHPIWGGLFNVAVGTFLLWCQFHAAFRRRAVSGFIVAAAFLIGGVLVVVLDDPESRQNELFGGIMLFVGIIMLRRSVRMWREQ